MIFILYKNNRELSIFQYMRGLHIAQTFQIHTYKKNSRRCIVSQYDNIAALLFFDYTFFPIPIFLFSCERKIILYCSMARAVRNKNANLAHVEYGARAQTHIYWLHHHHHHHLHYIYKDNAIYIMKGQNTVNIWKIVHIKYLTIS